MTGCCSSCQRFHAVQTRATLLAVAGPAAAKWQTHPPPTPTAKGFALCKPPDHATTTGAVRPSAWPISRRPMVRSGQTICKPSPSRSAIPTRSKQTIQRRCGECHACLAGPRAKAPKPGPSRTRTSRELWSGKACRNEMCPKTATKPTPPKQRFAIHPANGATTRTCPRKPSLSKPNWVNATTITANTHPSH